MKFTFLKFDLIFKNQFTIFGCEMSLEEKQKEKKMGSGVVSRFCWQCKDKDWFNLFVFCFMWLEPASVKKKTHKNEESELQKILFSLINMDGS